MVRRIQYLGRRNQAEAYTEIDLNQLVQDVIELTRPRWRSQTSQRGTHLELIVATAQVPPIWGAAPELREVLTQVQHDLFDLGGELCIPGMAMIHDADVERLETTLDAFNADLPALKDFILPGGGLAAACCHLARTVCRRAEREVVSLSRGESVRAEAIRYLNRLSDLLFVLARVLARASGHGEVLWQHERRKKPKS